MSGFGDFELTLDEEVSVQVFRATVEGLNREQLIENLVHLYALKAYSDRQYRELLKKEWGLEVKS